MSALSTAFRLSASFTRSRRINMWRGDREARRRPDRHGDKLITPIRDTYNKLARFTQPVPRSSAILGLGVVSLVQKNQTG